MLDLRLYRCAVAVAQFGSFRRASEALHISQPSLSRLIKDLEEHLGVRIFARARTGVTPTHEGELFLGRARDLLRDAENLEAEFHLLHRPGDLGLQVGAGPYPSTLMMAKALGRLINAFPSLPIEVMVKPWAELLPALQNRSITLFVADLSSTLGVLGLTYVPMKERVPYCALRANHPLLKEGKTPNLVELLEYPSMWPGYAGPDHMRRFIESWKEKLPNLEHVHKRVRMTCSSPTLIKSVLLESDAWSPFLIGQLLPELKGGSIRLIPGLFEANKATYGIVHLASRKLTKEEKAFIEFVVDEDAKLFAVERQVERQLFPELAKLSYACAD